MYDFSKKSFSRAEVEKILTDLRDGYDARLKEQKNRIFELVNEVRELKEYTQNSKPVGTAQDEKTCTEAEKRRLFEIAEKCEIYYSAIRQKYPVNAEIEGFGVVAQNLSRFIGKESSAAEKSGAQPLPQAKQELPAQFARENRAYKTKRLLRPAYIIKDEPKPQTAQELVRTRINSVNNTGADKEVIKTPAKDADKSMDELAAARDKYSLKQNGAAESFNPKSRIEKYIEKQDSSQKKSGFCLEEVLNPKKELNLEELCKELGLM